MTYHERMETMTAEDKKVYDEKKKEAAKAYKERRDNAKKVVNDWLNTNPRLPDEVKQAIEYITGSGVRSARTGVTSELKLMLMTKKSVSAVEIFQAFEYGKPTMERKIRDFIKVANPADRIWVAFENGNYVLKGTGENPPKDWTGFVPTKKEEL